ncbi:hypothetical protein G6L12_08220 [Agrobacterium rhizogenes]|nr:hypothetical protein [Rhizobium rhizogenes]NTF74458.1 hypothetical protein [Rhizobium rhizogenes]
MKNREPVGHDWLEEFREKFSDEFPEDQLARRAVERNVAADRVQVSRPVRAA